MWSHNFFFGVGWIHWGPRDNFFAEMGVEGIRTGIFSAILLCESNKFEITSAWGSRPPPLSRLSSRRSSQAIQDLNNHS